MVNHLVVQSTVAHQGTVPTIDGNVETEAIDFFKYAHISTYKYEYEVLRRLQQTTQRVSVRIGYRYRSIPDSRWFHIEHRHR